MDPDAWNNLGYTYNKLGRYDDAIKVCQHSLHIDPRHANAWYNIGVAYSFSGNQTAALDAIRKLRPLDPKKADKLFNLIKPH